MAWRYPERWFEGGEVIIPADPNASFGALAGEMNGRLDADNLPLLALGTSLMEAESINVVRAAKSSTTTTIDKETLGWQAIDTMNLDIGDGTPGGILSVDFSCTWQNATTASPQHAVWFRLTVDGSAAAETYALSMWHRNGSPYLCCNVPVGPGSHNVIAWARIAVWGGASTAPAQFDLDITGREMVARLAVR